MATVSTVGGSFWQNLFYKKYIAPIFERLVGLGVAAGVYYGLVHSLGQDPVLQGLSIVMAPLLVYIALTVGHLPFNKEALQNKDVQSMIKESSFLAIADVILFTLIAAVPGISVLAALSVFTLVSMPLLIKHYRLNIQGRYAAFSPTIEQQRIAAAIPAAVSVMQRIPLIKEHTATQNVPPEIGISPKFTAAAKDLFTLTQA